MGKGKKGKKGSKKKNKEAEEAERLAREEEERIRLEAEKERLEQERIAKEIRDKEEVEEAATKREQELTRLHTEECDFEPDFQRQENQASDAIRKRMEENEWNTFTHCSNRPQVTCKAELNTFLNEWSSAEECNLESVLRECQESLAITTSIEEYLSSTYFHVNGSVEEREEYVQYLRRFREVEIKKLDQGTAHVLLNPAEYATPKNEILVNASSEDGNVKYGLWSNLASKGFRIKTIEFEGMNVVVEIPKALALQSIAVRAILINRDTDIDQVQSNNDFVVGSGVVVEVLQLPPPSKVTRGWVLRPKTVFSETVQRILHPLGAPGESAGLPSVGGANTNMITVKFKIPESVAVDQSFTVLASQDGKTRNWVEDKVQEVEINTETGWVSFQTNELRPVSLLQRKSIDFPLKSWGVTPFPDGTVHVTFQGARWDVVIACENGLCSLISPQHAALSALLGVRMQVGSLLNRLAISGINLRATTFDDASAPWRTSAKASKVEQAAYRMIGQLSGSMEVVPSSWNNRVAASSACFKIKEGHLLAEAQAPGAEAETAMYTVLVETDEELKHGIKFRVVSEENLELCFNDNELLAPSAKLNLNGIQSGINLGSLLLDNSVCSAEAYKAAMDAGPLQHVTVFHLLDLIRPLSTCFEIQGIVERNDVDVTAESMVDADGNEQAPQDETLVSSETAAVTSTGDVGEEEGTTAEAATIALADGVADPAGVSQEATREAEPTEVAEKLQAPDTDTAPALREAEVDEGTQVA